MKTAIATLITLAATAAIAHPGGNSLVCKSSANSGGKQKLALEIDRSNGVGWYAPTIKLTVDGKLYDFSQQDEMKQYGETEHDSPLGVIIVTADTEETQDKNRVSLNITALPQTVKTYDGEGKLQKWSFKKAGEECYDTDAKAKFKAIIRGHMDLDNPGSSFAPVDTEILDCTLTYDPGMAC